MSAASRQVCALASLLTFFASPTLGVTTAKDQSATSNQPAVRLPADVAAVWDLDRADRQTTPTRERICINGLWRWQPAEDDAEHVPAERWGYFKVPGCWPGVTDYMQKDCQRIYAHPAWQATPLAKIAAAWYQREIAIPDQWQGRRIVLSADYVNSFATVFIDGLKVGQIRYPAGEVDLSQVCQPGQRYRLSIHVIAMPLRGVMESYRDTATARQVEGRVARRGLCGDVYLESTPVGPRICDAQIATSVRQWSIGIRVRLAELQENTPYVLQARIMDGEKQVLRFDSPAFAPTSCSVVA